MTNLTRQLHSDSISIVDFALILEQHNQEIGDFVFFSSLIYDAIEASKLTPLLLPFSYATPFRERDFKFAPDVLITWAKAKSFKVPQTTTSETNQPEWSAAETYKNEWQTSANSIKKENPGWKKPAIAKEMRSQIIAKHPNFPYSSSTIARHISIADTKKSQSSA